MRKAEFSTVFTAQNCNEAKAVVQELRTIGLHPADLGLTSPIAVGGSPPTFPVEVPTEEAQQAKGFLSANHPAAH